MPAMISFSVFFQIAFLSILFCLGIYFLGFILRYKPENKNSDSACGYDIEPIENTGIKIQPNFYTFALCFLLFEAECVLMFPFAYASKAMDIYYITEIMIFILILVCSVFYGIKSGLFKMD